MSPPLQTMLEQSNTIILVLIQHEATTYHYKAYKINETRLVLRTMGRFTTRTESKPFVKIEQIFIPKRRKEEKNKVISSTFSTAELEKLSPNQGHGAELPCVDFRPMLPPISFRLLFCWKFSPFLLVQT